MSYHLSLITKLVDSDLHSWERLSVFAFISDYLGLELVDAVLKLIGCVGGAAGDIVLHAVSQLRQTAFHHHQRQGGKQLFSLLGLRSSFLPRCHHPDLSSLGNLCPVTALCLASISWLHRFFLSLGS